MLTEFEDSFSEEVWRSTYKNYKDNDVNDTFRRVAKAVASVENTESLRVKWEDKFYDLLSDFKATCGGRIYANAGTDFGGTTLMNCYVGPRGNHDIDSLEGIINSLKNQALTLKSEGGWGENFSYIRPRGAFIHGIGVESPGAVKYMELFDKSSEIVTSGSGKKSTNSKAKGKIRKGAMMGVLDCWHPDIMEFILAKQQPGRLTKFNISVNCTNEFMDKVVNVVTLSKQGKEDTEEFKQADKWDLIFPVTNHPAYKKEWNGDVALWRNKNYPIDVYNTISVKRLWNTLMESTYNRADPGILFLDIANKYGPLNYLETIFATNPCVTGDTTILTDKGYVEIKDVVGQSVNIWNGFEWSSVVPKVTGKDQEILDISFSDGSKLSCTPYHGFYLNNGTKVEAKDLKHDDELIEYSFPVINGERELDHAYAHGVYSGDGSVNHNHVWLYGDKAKLKEFLPVRSFSDQSLKNGMARDLVILDVKGLDKAFVPDATYSLKSRLDWFAGLVDTDGHCTNGNVQITSIDYDFLLSVKRMLNTLGVNPVLSLARHASLRMLPDGKGGKKEYQTKDCYRISLSKSKTLRLVSLGLKTNHTKLNDLPVYKTKYTLRVRNIVKRENKEPLVYCFNEPLRHMGVFNGVCTAQCGEQTLSPGNVCNLGSLNLVKFVNESLTGFDLDKIKKYVHYLVRFLDNVNDLSNAPLPEYEYSMKNKRRIGCGILGWSSALYMLQVRFGSEKADQLREEVMSTIAKEAYKASVDLAKEKGMFPLCDPPKHVNGEFVKGLGLDESTLDDMRTYGIRNSSLISIQPTGNTSIFANIVSGGLEPMFLHEYIRTAIENTVPEHIKDVTPKWYEGEWKETELFKLANEGSDEILRGVDPYGVVYKIDKSRGLTKEVLCEDYGVRYMKAKGKWNPNADWAVTTNNLTVKDHLNDLKGFARWVDSAMSKTVNVPNDYPFEDFADIYLDAYKSGYVKGVTTYRSGTMMTVLSAKEEKLASKEDEEIILEDVKLPDSSPSTMKTLKAEGRKWYLTVVWNDAKTRPFALFVNTNSHEKSIITGNAVEQLLTLAKDKGIPDKHIQSVMDKINSDSNATRVARLISLNLRHGVLIKNIVAALDKVDDVFVGSFLFQVRKFLASFIKEGEKVEGQKCNNCGSHNIVFSEGCQKCADCGTSKCG